MNADRLYQELKDLSERLGIEVSEQNFRATGIKARSGYCVIRGTPMFLIDKNKRLQRRIAILSEFLGCRITEDVFMVPAVREHLDKYRPKRPRANKQPELFPAKPDDSQ
ncbi:MAG: hypothetical protein QNI97_13310 [Desulfobacterales bacterium]|nr:hypothetical protein [Desulfobacterales bacterium]